MTQVASEQWLSIEDGADAIAPILTTAASIGCLAHKDADADSLGSALGFALSLRQMGRTVHCIVPEPMPQLLTYLPGYETVSTAAPPKLDALFTFDCATRARFGEKAELLSATPVVVNIDHHLGNDSFGTINIVDAHASATGEVVFRLLRAVGAPLTPESANNLYAALLTDTGGFRHENTTEASLRLAADLVSLGADPALMALKSYKSHSVAQLRLEGLCVAALHTERDGALIYSAVTTEMLASTGANMQEADGIIDALQSVAPMQVALLFKELGPGRVKVSVRTRDGYDSTAVCRPFGGGGHRRAAGAEIELPLAQAQEAVLKVARDVLDAKP